MFSGHTNHNFLKKISKILETHTVHEYDVLEQNEDAKSFVGQQEKGSHRDDVLENISPLPHDQFSQIYHAVKAYRYEIFHFKKSDKSLPSRPITR